MYENDPAFDGPTRESIADELDPHSPARQRADKLALAAKIIRILSYVVLGIFLVSHFADTSAMPVYAAFIMFAVTAGGMILAGYLEDKSLALVCTRRTTALCVETVRRHSGKHIRYRPIVEYEANGKFLRTELRSVYCSRHDEGKTYTLFYDPLDEKKIRVDKLRRWRQSHSE